MGASLSLVLTSPGSDLHASRESAESSTESRFLWTESVTPPTTITDAEPARRQA